MAAGYVVALLIASAGVALYVASTSGPDRKTYGGMYAFGDSLLFLAVFALAAAPATGAALYFLSSEPHFWRARSVGALAIAATGLAALIVRVAVRTAGAGSVLLAWSGLAVLRILAAPLLALGFVLCALFAPSRSSRIALVVATALEAAVFVYLVVVWFLPALSR